MTDVGGHGHGCVDNTRAGIIRYAGIGAASITGVTDLVFLALELAVQIYSHRGNLQYWTITVVVYKRCRWIRVGH